MIWVMVTDFNSRDQPHKWLIAILLLSLQRLVLFRYIVGQFSELDRKSIEPVALSVENGAVRSMQRAVSDTVWNEDKMIGRYRGLVG
jgi:hypothetical protein